MTDQVILQFEKPGMHTLVQDLGRSGYQEYGVPVGGVLDKRAATTANRLVGNPKHAPVLEVALAGPVIRVTGTCQMAVTGADMSPEIDGKPIPMYETVSVARDQVIRLKYPRSGFRSYIAIGGSWDIQPWMGSVSPMLYEPLATPGSNPAISREIRINPLLLANVRSLSADQQPEFKSKITIRVLPGPEFSRFDSGVRDALMVTEFEVSKEINRMGVRLKQPLRGYQPDTEIISSGIVPGTIQVTNAGHPIILLADAQTSGGYPRIANVITPDLDLLAQMAPGNTIHFRMITFDDAISAVQDYQRLLEY